MIQTIWNRFGLAAELCQSIWFLKTHIPTTCLTHLPLDKMAAILADDIFKCIFLNEKFCILIRIALKFAPTGPIGKNPALV